MAVNEFLVDGACKVDSGSHCDHRCFWGRVIIAKAERTARHYFLSTLVVYKNDVQLSEEKFGRCGLTVNRKLAFYSVGTHFLPTQFLGVIVDVIQVILGTRCSSNFITW